LRNIKRKRRNGGPGARPGHAHHAGVAHFGMAGTLTYYDGGSYLRAQVNGSPTLDEFLSLLSQIGGESAKRAKDLVLLDLQSVGRVYTFTEQFTVGQEIARSMMHLRKLASVVPPDRITRVSEKAANHSGANVRVFTSEAEAMQWLLTA